MQPSTSPSGTSPWVLRSCGWMRAVLPTLSRMFLEALVRKSSYRTIPPTITGHLRCSYWMTVSAKRITVSVTTNVVWGIFSNAVCGIFQPRCHTSRARKWAGFLRSAHLSTDRLDDETEQTEHVFWCYRTGRGHRRARLEEAFDIRNNSLLSASEPAHTRAGSLGQHGTVFLLCFSSES